MIERKCSCQERAAIARARARAEREEAEEEREEVGTNRAAVSGPLGGRTGAPGCGHDHSKDGARAQGHNHVHGHVHGHNHAHVPASPASDAKTGEQLRGGVLFDDQMSLGSALNSYGGASPEQTQMLAARRAAGCPCLGACTCGRFRRIPAGNAGNPTILENQKAVCSCRRRSWRA